MALSDAERAANYRYASRVEKTARKLSDLLANPPDKYSPDLSALPNKPRVDDLVFGCVSMLVGAPWEFVEHGKDVALRYVISMEGVPEISEDMVLMLNPEYADEQRRYEAFDKLTDVSTTTTRLKLTRNAFCETILGAELANPRWGWVGVKEPESDEPGALYIFGWEHNRGTDGPDTVGLFHSKLEVDERGRRRPGHRDALEKIQRAITGELKPFVVWQTAVDPESDRKRIESINGDYVSEVDLYIDKNGFWTGRIGNPVRLQPISERKG